VSGRFRLRISPERRGLIRAGHKMVKKKMKVLRHTVILEINRKLAAKGHILKAKRGARLKRYYILDLSGKVMDADIDLEELARKLGVLLEMERRPKKLGRKARPE
jgi:hypothetical protein